MYTARPSSGILHADATKASDALLEAYVVSALASHPELDATAVAVTARQGQVILTGRMARVQEIGRCTEIALGASGIVAIHNLIQVGTGDIL